MATTIKGTGIIASTDFHTVVWTGPGESQGWGSLVGCRLWSRTESDTTEAT